MLRLILKSPTFICKLWCLSKSEHSLKDLKKYEPLSEMKWKLTILVLHGVFVMKDFFKKLPQNNSSKRSMPLQMTSLHNMSRPWSGLTVQWPDIFYFHRSNQLPRDEIKDCPTFSSSWKIFNSSFHSIWKNTPPQLLFHTDFKQNSQFPRHLTSSLAKRNKWDIAEISLVIFLSEVWVTSAWRSSSLFEVARSLKCNSNMRQCNCRPS